MANTKRILAATAAAAATGAVAVAAKKIIDGTAIYSVRPDGEGWMVKSVGSKRASSRHETKKQAVHAAKRIAEAKRPSRLVIFTTDGDIQRWHDYDKT